MTVVRPRKPTVLVRRTARAPHHERSAAHPRQHAVGDAENERALSALLDTDVSGNSRGVLSHHHRSGTMSHFFAGVLAVLVLTGCVHSGPSPSDPVSQPLATPDLTVGMLSDTQIQTFAAWHARNDFRGAWQEHFENVTIRPPALDYTSRDLLLAHLSRQAQAGATALFYLGDGANHGCRDELFGFAPSAFDTTSHFVPDSLHRQGVFEILGAFRSRERKPIFFVLGNHDFLGAGNTEHETTRSTLCGSEANVVRKSELIAVADSFNRSSAVLAKWTYASSAEVIGEHRTDAQRVNLSCTDTRQAETRQSRRHGCHYAAVLETSTGAKTYRFLLLDTNDYPDVTQSKIARFVPFLRNDFEGMRGAMSFREQVVDGVSRCGPLKISSSPSQTCWLASQAARPIGSRKPDVAVALSHYNVHGFQKSIGPVRLASYTQRFADLFVARAHVSDSLLQRDAFAVTAHTHTDSTAVATTGFTERGRTHGRTPLIAIQETNIGSTTDFPSLSALVNFHDAGGRTVVTHNPVELNVKQCPAILTELESADASRADADVRHGRAALALSFNDRFAYRKLTQRGAEAVFTNIAAFIRGDPNRAVCVGLEAGRMEAGKSSFVTEASAR